MNKSIKLYRIFFSVPTIIVFMFILLIMSNAVDQNGNPVATWQWIFISICFYIMILFPINLLIRLIERICLKVPFGEMLERPLFHLFSKDADKYKDDRSIIERLKNFKDGYSVKMLWADILYFIDCILFPPAKVMFIIWTICWGTAYISNRTMPGAGEVAVIFVGYFIYCGLADLIYYAFQKKYYKYQLKITERHMKRLKALMDEIDPEYFKQRFPGNSSDTQSEYDSSSITKNVLNALDEQYFDDAVHLAVQQGGLSIGMVQRHLKVGFNQAARIVDKLEEAGIVGTEQGTRPRDVLVDEDMLAYILSKRAAISVEKPCEVENVTHNVITYDEMEGHQFEYFCADILEKNGFTKVEVTKGSGDHGVDIFAEYGDATYAIQCKRYARNINNKAIQEALTGKTLYHKDVAVVLTNQYFTPQAKEEAEMLGVKLWDRDKLNEMVRNANLIQ